MGYLITLVASASSWLLKLKVRRKVPAETVARFGRTLGLTPHRTNYHLARLIPQWQPRLNTTAEPHRRRQLNIYGWQLYVFA